MANDAYLGSFEYDASKEPGLKWLDGPRSYELNFVCNCIGNFITAQAVGSTHKHVRPIDPRIPGPPPFPPLAEAWERAKKRGLIK